MSNMIQGYFLINREEMSEEQSSEFNQSLAQYSILYRKINSVDNRDLYHAVMRHPEDIPNLIEHLKYRNVEVLGVWNRDGTELGTELIVEYNEETEESTETLIGEPIYPYQKITTESYLEDAVSIDEEGNITEIRGKIHHSFSGFTERGI